jgi:N-acetylglutamate synthase/N-acetylornithine aminotransferase
MKNFMIALASSSIRHKTAKYTAAPTGVMIAKYTIDSISDMVTVPEILVNCGIIRSAGIMTTDASQYLATCMHACNALEVHKMFGKRPRK